MAQKVTLLIHSKSHMNYVVAFPHHALSNPDTTLHLSQKGQRQECAPVKKPAFFFVPLPFWKSSQELCRLFVSVSIFWKRILLLYDLASFFFFTRVFASSSGCISSHCTCAAVHSSSVHSGLPAGYDSQGCTPTFLSIHLFRIQSRKRM